MATYLNGIRSHQWYQRVSSSLTAKLGLAFAIIALLSLIVGVTAIASVNISSTRLETLLVTNQQKPELLQQALSSFVQARTEDISFLRVYPERGLSFATTQHVRAWERQIDNVNETLLELKGVTDTSGDSLLTDEDQRGIDRLLQNIEDYVTKFDAAVIFIQLNQEGDFSGNIGETAAALEEQVLLLETDHLQAAVLRIRHIELTFLQSGDKLLVDQHTEAVESFKQLLEESDAGSVGKSNTDVALNAYATQFQSVVTANGFIENNIKDYQLLATTAEEALRELLSQEVLASEQAAVATVATIRNSITLLIALSLTTFIVSLFAAFSISRGINTQVSSTLDMFKRLQMGDFSARAKVTTRDELGQIAESINGVLDNNAELIQTQDESLAIQESIGRLLNDITTAADGDLTTQAKVTDDITGAIADSFNFMIEQLREVITQVRDASLQVSSSANEIQTTAEHLSQGSQQQTEQIVDTTSAIDEMSVSIQRVSENAAICATVSEQAKVDSDVGSEAVQQTILSMGRIQGQVNRTSEQLQRLRLSMREIDNVVRIIDSVAERTGILAINASIQAAAAGTARESFALVASEVDDLAQRSGEATQQISKLVRQIQYNTQSATATIASTNLEVNQGLRLANSAGERLLEIESVADRLAELIRQISQAAKQQARGSETIAKSMGDISAVTQQSAEGTQEATVSIRNLARLADELRSSVSTFKLASEATGRYIG
ncbi:MAG: methyl-accepting chemotaxis protein [Candidatus Promineifilaceae bacterium]